MKLELCLESLGNKNLPLRWTWGMENIMNDIVCWIDLALDLISVFNTSMLMLISSNTRS